METLKARAEKAIAKKRQQIEKKDCIIFDKLMKKIIGVTVKSDTTQTTVERVKFFLGNDRGGNPVLRGNVRCAVCEGEQERTIEELADVAYLWDRLKLYHDTCKRDY